MSDETTPVAAFPPKDWHLWAQTGCRRCHSAGRIVTRAFLPRPDADGNAHGPPQIHRCACTNKKLRRAGYEVVAVEPVPVPVSDPAAP